MKRGPALAQPVAVTAAPQVARPGPAGLAGVHRKDDPAPATTNVAPASATAGAQPGRPE